MRTVDDTCKWTCDLSGNPEPSEQPKCYLNGSVKEIDSATIASLRSAGIVKLDTALIMRFATREWIQKLSDDQQTEVDILSNGLFGTFRIISVTRETLSCSIEFKLVEVTSPSGQGEDDDSGDDDDPVSGEFKAWDVIVYHT
jgi:hypothetical protein